MLTSGSWWDETIEATSPTGFTGATAFLNPTTGFGPNGNLDVQGCVSSGFFSDVKVNIGPGFQNLERCVSRGVNNNFSSLLTPAAVATSLNHDTYEDMWRDVYAGPHFWGHGALLLMVRLRLNPELQHDFSCTYMVLVLFRALLLAAVAIPSFHLATRSSIYTTASSTGCGGNGRSVIGLIG